MKVGILFGSSSNEHDVSIVSASALIENIDKEKYEVIPIYLDKRNNFYIWDKDVKKISVLTLGSLPDKLKRIKDPFNYLQEFDLIFIMIHGQNGEDGIISSILEFLNIPYVGQSTMASVITMDKILTKEILEKNGIKTSPYIYFSNYNNEFIYEGNPITKQDLYKIITNKISYPLFIKPASSGSSIGISKVKTNKDLDRAIKKALEVDHRILIEKCINGREIECAILERDKEIITSDLGEVISASEFYDFEAKYANTESITVIPANISQRISQKMQNIASKVFKILDCHIYSRCDFFITADNKILVNEINTIPGLTNISLYPQSFLSKGINFKDLIDIIINSSLNK